MKKIVMVVLISLIVVGKLINSPARIEYSTITHNAVTYEGQYLDLDSVSKHILSRFKYSKFQAEELSNILRFTYNRCKIKNVDFIDILCIISRESSWRSWVHNGQGSSAFGLMQTIESTSKGLGYVHNRMYDPYVSIAAGIDYVKYTSSIFNGNRLIVSYSSWIEARGNIDCIITHPFVIAHNRYLWFFKKVLYESLIKDKIQWIGKSAYTLGKEVENLNYWRLNAIDQVRNQKKLRLAKQQLLIL